MTATPRSAARTAGAHVCFLSVARTALSARIRSAAPPKLADIPEARASVAYQGDTEQRDEAVSERVQTEAETEPTGHQQIGRERIRCDQDDEGAWNMTDEFRRPAWCSAMDQASVGAGSSLKQ